MNGIDLEEIGFNKAIRGYIIRCLVKCSNNRTIVKQISNSLFASRMIMSPDISKYLDYLIEAGYVEKADCRVKSYPVYGDEDVIKLTKAGVDLAEGTTEDSGVDV